MFACSRLLFSLIGLAWMLFCVPCLADDADTELSKTFAADVQPLLAKYCVRCHNGDEMKSGIRVDQLDATLQDRHLFLWRDIKKQLDEHAMPPEDETQPTPEERERFSRWIEHAMNVAKSRNTQKNGSIRRLTVSQYRNTMRTLLGLNENLSEFCRQTASRKKVSPTTDKSSVCRRCRWSTTLRSLKSRSICASSTRIHRPRFRTSAWISDATSMLIPARIR